jgi:hypothetical protein
MFAKAYVGRKRWGEAPSKVCLFSRPSTNPRVPYISLVFREMWDTTALDGQLSRSGNNSRSKHLSSRPENAEQRDLRSIPAMENAAVRPPPSIEAATLVGRQNRSELRPSA